MAAGTDPEHVPPVRFYREAITEGERELFDAAGAVEGLQEEIAVLRTRLFTAVKEHPEDLRLLIYGVGMLVRAVAAEYRLSPKARRDLADHLAGVVNSLADQLVPADR